MEAFVYEWINLTNNKKYIGYHKGSKDDGYVCSSSSSIFWEDFKNPNMKWQRRILAEGTTDACLIIEQRILKEIDLKSDEFYNNARGSEVIFTDEVKEKIRQHHLGGSSGMKGKKHTDETKRKQSEALKDRIFTQEHLNKLRKPNKDSSNKKGPKSEAHIMNMKESFKKRENIQCPHCEFIGKPANVKRWHFDNCKLKKD